MKIFKILKTIFLSLAIVLFLSTIIICAIQSKDLIDSVAHVNDLLFTALITAFGIYLFAILGAFLLTAKSDIAHKIGHSFLIFSFLFGLTLFVSALGSDNMPLALIIMLIAIIMLVLYYICNLVIVIVNKNIPDAENPSDDVRIANIRAWKKVMEEGIISEEEYEEKRCKILGIKPKGDK